MGSMVKTNVFALCWCAPMAEFNLHACFLTEALLSPGCLQSSPTGKHAVCSLAFARKKWQSSTKGLKYSSTRFLCVYCTKMSSWGERRAMMASGKDHWTQLPASECSRRQHWGPYYILLVKLQHLLLLSVGFLEFFLLDVILVSTIVICLSDWMIQLFPRSVLTLLKLLYMNNSLELKYMNSFV